MKRILFALTILIFSNVAIAQNSEKLSDYKATSVEQKEQINAKYEEIKGLLEKENYDAAKQKYADVSKMMEQSLESDKKFLRKAKTAEEKATIERKIASKTRLFEASKPFSTADLSKDGKRLSIFIMEFAYVSVAY